MKSTVLLFSILAVILLSYATALHEDTMDTSKTNINLVAPRFGSDSSGILKSHDGTMYKINNNKTLYISAPIGYRLLVAIRVIDLRPNYADQLKLFSVNGQVNPLIFVNSGRFQDRRYYPREDLTFEVPNGRLGVTFTTGPYTFFGYDGFKLIYTVQASWLQCTSDLFHCDNSRCIANILKCDGHNHCGDGSSQKNCSIIIPGFGTGRTVGLAFGMIFLIIAIACGVVIIIRRARGADTETTVITSHPPPSTNLPSYPPVYPQPGTYYPPPPPPYSQGVTNPAYH